MFMFVLVNLAFILGMVWMIFEHPPALAWAVFIASWFVADAYVVHKTGMDLSPAQWLLLIGFLTVLDLAILHSTGRLQLPFIN